MEPSDVCARFHADPTRNPRSGRLITKDGPTYKELVKECGPPPLKGEIRQTVKKIPITRGAPVSLPKRKVLTAAQGGKEEEEEEEEEEREDTRPIYMEGAQVGTHFPPEIMELIARKTDPQTLRAMAMSAKGVSSRFTEETRAEAARRGRKKAHIHDVSLEEIHMLMNKLDLSPRKGDVNPNREISFNEKDAHLIRGRMVHDAKFLRLLAGPEDKFGDELYSDTSSDLHLYLQEPEYMKVLYEYLLKRDYRVGMLRGDIVSHDSEQDLVVDTNRLRPLVYNRQVDDEGFLPPDFKVITEFPIQYWSGEMNEIVWLDNSLKSRFKQTKMTLKNLKKIDPNIADYDQFESVIINPKKASEDELEEGKRVEIYTLEYSGKEYYLVVLIAYLEEEPFRLSEISFDTHFCFRLDNEAIDNIVVLDIGEVEIGLLQR